MTTLINTVLVLHFQIQERESANMKVLADEWKKRDKERELMVRRKVRIYYRNLLNHRLPKKGYSSSNPGILLNLPKDAIKLKVSN